MSVTNQDIRNLVSYFIPRDQDSAMGGDIFPDVNEGHNLGRAAQRWDTIYAREVIADTVVGGGGAGGEADTVDGFHASGSPEAGLLLALTPQADFPTSVYPKAILKDGSRSLEGSLTVFGGATIDTIDLDIHAHTGSAGHGVQINHLDLLNNDADVHPQYTQRAQDEIITGDWMFTHLLDRSAGWKFLPDDKKFVAVPFNMEFYADETRASIEIGPDVGGEKGITLWDDATSTYIKIGRVNDAITLSSTDPTYRMWAGHASAASAPFRVEADGSIFATDGLIGGWQIFPDRLENNDMFLSSAGELVAGTGTNVVQIDAIDPTWRLWAGNTDPTIAPFAVNKVGQLYMKDAFVNGTLKSQNFVSGLSGFSLDSSGLIEAHNIIARGRIQSVIYAEAAVSVVGGSFVISDGAAIAVDVDPADDFIIVDSPALDLDDIIHIKPDANRSEWMRIGSTVIVDPGGFKYAVTRGINASDPAFTGPYQFYAGETVVRKGSAFQSRETYPLSAGESGGELGEFQPAGSGATTQGGYLVLEGGRNFGPFFGVTARFGPVYDQLLDVVRIGNLNGILDYTEEEWGAFFGDNNNFMAYDQTQGLRIQFLGGGVDTSIGSTGLLTDTISLGLIASAPAYVDQEAKIWFEDNAGDLRLMVRMKSSTDEEEQLIGDMHRDVYDADLDGLVDDSDAVDGIHAASTATANQLLALDGNAKLPADITGDADTVDGVHGGELYSSAGSELTIATGAISIPSSGDSFFSVDTESDAAEDDLVTINGGSDGDIVLLVAANDARTVNIVHGTGNIVTRTGADLKLDSTSVLVALRYNGTNWVEIVGSAGAGDFLLVQAFS